MAVKEEVVRGRILLFVLLTLGCMAMAGEIFPSAFWGQGEAAADMVWLSPSGFARWQFSSLPLGCEGLTLELTARASGEAPEVIPVHLRVFTPSLPQGRAFRVELHKVGPGSYFGQLCLSRRDIGMGSSLSVRLVPCPLGVAIGVDRHSLSLRTGEPGSVIVAKREQEYAGWWAPAVQAAGSPQLPEADRAWEATYIAPGTYGGELGWKGPGFPPDGVDWFKVNLLPGQLVRITFQVQPEVPCTLRLCDPAGRPVAELRSGYELGLEYRVGERGPWLVCVALHEGQDELVHYSFSLEIRP